MFQDQMCCANDDSRDFALVITNDHISETPSKQITLIQPDPRSDPNPLGENLLEYFLHIPSFDTSTG